MTEITTFTMAAFVIVGLVNGVQFAFDRNWKSFTFFLIAVAAGTLFGAIHWFNLPSAEIGLAVGVGSSGVYKVAQKLGGQ